MDHVHSVDHVRSVRRTRVPPGKQYGGNDPMDNSGTLSYVRVWYGGAIVGEGNEINGK